MSMTYPYCNTTSDLEYAFKDIEKFAGKEVLETWTIVSGQTKTYYKLNTGYVGIVYQNGALLTEKTSIATVEATAGTWWYDSTNDILYAHSTDNADPDTHTIEIAAEDWATLKTYMANNAYQQLEALLDPKYPRPLPFATVSYNSFNYDADIVYCAALLTCINIIRHRDPDNPIIQTLQDLVWNANEQKGILWEYSKGLRAFTFQATIDEFDGNISLVSRDNASTGNIWVAGNGDRSGSYNINVVIVTGGAVGTATFKYSLDNKATYSSVITTAYQYVPILSGLYLKFAGTFVADDEWLLTILGDPEMVTQAGFKNIELRRNI